MHVSLIYKSLAVLIAASFLSSTPADARRRHHHGHRHKHIERHIDRGDRSDRNCVNLGSLDTVRVEHDFSQKEAVKFTEVTWQDMYASANTPFDSLSPMVELPPTEAKKRTGDFATIRENLGAIFFGGIMIFGSVLAILPHRRKRV